jgi:hypothetical protein
MDVSPRVIERLLAGGLTKQKRMPMLSRVNGRFGFSRVGLMRRPRSRHVRFAPKATVADQNVIRR